MWLEGIVVVTLLNIFQNDAFPMISNGENCIEKAAMKIKNQHSKEISIKNYEDYAMDAEKKQIDDQTKKPCSIVVLSNIQNPNVRSLLRKYRYDANGILIPSSVKYFLKLPRESGDHSSPLLVPLNDKAFSPVGGFVRYYKEVPPIPHSW